jgi:hypothetical protein
MNADGFRIGVFHGNEDMGAALGLLMPNWPKGMPGNVMLRRKATIGVQPSPNGRKHARRRWKHISMRAPAGLGETAT